MRHTASSTNTESTRILAEIGGDRLANSHRNTCDDNDTVNVIVDRTRKYLDGIRQDGGVTLPQGPVIMSPDRLFQVRHLHFCGTSIHFTSVGMPPILSPAKHG